MNLAPNQIIKMTNPQLNVARNALAKRQEESANSTLLEEINNPREEIHGMKEMKREVELLTTRLDDPYTTLSGISGQQGETPELGNSGCEGRSR